MGLFSPNPTKQRQIELQNILFDTEEKKLMVSTEFLNDMTTSYVSKRMKNINKMTENIVATRNPDNFFAYCDSIERDLEELIRIEPYHNFKDPVPSEFKKILESRMSHFTENMIKRTWKSICQRTGLDHDGNRDPKYYGPVLDALIRYKDKYSPSQLELVDKFYQSVYHVSMIELEEPEVPETEEGIEAADSELPADELVLGNEEEDVPGDEEEDIEEAIILTEEDSE